jgi:putative chitinase
VSFLAAIEALGGVAYADSIVRNAERWHIDTPLRQAHWLAQMAHESEGFRYVRELWGPTEQQRKYEPPSALATELGNTLPGDGLRFRGRGFIQVTGRANYRECSFTLYGDERLVFNPELLEHDPAASAGWYWASRSINRFADRDDVRKVTKAINGRYIGLADRIRRLNIAKQAMEAAFRDAHNATH